MSFLLDALSYFGEAADKPGRAIRGVLGGRPHEALAAIPFSDTLGWTDPADLARRSARWVEEHHPHVDVVVYDGGQERYPLLLSVE